MKKMTWAVILLAVLAVMGAGTAQAQVTFYDDFSSDPDIAGDWDNHIYYKRAGTATWNSGDEDLDLAAGGNGADGEWYLLSRTGATRTADESVTLDVTSLSASTTFGSDWTFFGLAISSNAAPNLLGDTSPIYTFRLASLGANINAGLWVYQVIEHGGALVYNAPTTNSFTPVTMEIRRNGDEYDFLADDVVLYTTSGDYSAAEHDSMTNYHIGHGAGTFTTNDASADNFGVVVDLPLPVQYWRLDDNGGSTVANHISGGNVGTLANTPTWTSSSLASELTSRTDWPSTAALDFDQGASWDYIDCGNINLTSTGGGGGEVTVSLWLNPDSFALDDRILGQLGGPTTQAGAVGEGIYGDGALWVWDGGAQRQIANAGALSTGAWQHLALVWDTGQVTAYLDGAKQLTASSSFQFGSGDGNLGIAGKYVNLHGDGFDGKMDDIAIFDVALTPAEVAALALGQEPVPPPRGTLISIQ